MSTQPEPAQFNANEWTVEQMWSAFDRGELTRESLTEGISILATAAARAEVARQVRELPGYIEQRGAGELVEYVVLRPAVLALLDAAPRQPEPETVWKREREQLAKGGHRIAGPAMQTQDGRWGEAEEACRHGRSAHSDKGCRDCACKVTYDGGLAAPDTTTAAQQPPEVREPER